MVPAFYYEFLKKSNTETFQSTRPVPIRPQYAKSEQLLSKCGQQKSGKPGNTEIGGPKKNNYHIALGICLGNLSRVASTH